MNLIAHIFSISVSPAEEVQRMDCGFGGIGTRRRSMKRVFLVSPALSKLGYSIITPRWLFVIARATPTDLVGDPILIDEAIERFDPKRVLPGDIVGIGISTGNCLAGYDILKRAKSKGATVIVGGINPHLFS